MAIAPAGLDSRLVQSFQKAVEGRGDGRVSEADVKQAIAPLLSGDGQLSEIEKKTLEWAVDNFNITGAARRVLSEELTKLAGEPVFQWQRELAGPMAVRLGTGLPQAQLDRKAGECYQQNTSATGSGWDAMFNHPEAGNSGTHVLSLEGDAAERHLKFMAAVNPRVDLLDKFSTDTHAIYSVYESDDEEHFGAIFVDKRTGEATPIDTYNIVDVGYDLDIAKWTELFGPPLNSDGEPITDPDEFADFASETDVGELLGRDAADVELPHFSEAQRERRRTTLRDAMEGVMSGLRDATGDRHGTITYDVLARTDNLDGRLLELAEEVDAGSWRDRSSGQPVTVVDGFRPLDGAARGALVATMRKGAPDLDSDKMDAVIAALGETTALKFATVDIPMSIRDYQTNSSTEFVARAHIVVNEMEGDWFGIYDRPRMPDE